MIASAAALSQALANEVLGTTGAQGYGGGFAGTTLHIVPNDKIQVFKEEMDAAFGLALAA